TVLSPQRFMVLRESGVQRNAIYGAHFFTLRHVKMPDALCAFVWIYLVNLFAHVNRVVRALRLAHVAIDTFVGNQQCDTRCLFSRCLFWRFSRQVRCF
ncbi:MAG: hypothetical protein RLY82_971, partial [Pseudomonadota bacterium]